MIYNDSPLYQLQSKRNLMYLLKIPSKDYLKQAKVSLMVKPYIETKPKERLIEAPSYELKKIQARLKFLLMKLKFPENVFSGIKGRSYIDNAKYHQGINYLYKVDLKAFFPNISREKVFSFFKQKFDTSQDVAEILTNLTTVDLDLTQADSLKEINLFLDKKGIKTKNHLITGSPTSPILSYLVNIDMFEDLQNIADKNNLKMSIYIDDIIFSSKYKISYQVRNKILSTILLNGFCLSRQKIKLSTNLYPKCVTGVIINSKGNITTKNSLRYKIIHEFKILKDFPDDTDCRRRLRGLVTAARQCEPNIFPSIRAFAFDKKFKI